MTTCRSWTTFSFILLFGILPSEGGLAADVDRDPQACIKPCPRSPNCVSSLEGDKRHAIEPILYTGTLEDAREALLWVLRAQPRLTLIASEPDSIHAEFKSRWFGFVDDVMFYFPAGQPLIHVRSASRTGYYDFGVNRKRVEHMCSLLETALSSRSDGK
jgi:uncharacterized protein (DUF1499 family)